MGVGRPLPDGGTLPALLHATRSLGEKQDLVDLEELGADGPS